MSGSAGLGSMLGGGSGMAHGGHGGDGGDGGALEPSRLLRTCDWAITPILDGPLARETNGSVNASVSGDWDHDGRLDLAISNAEGSVSVLFSNGDGSFTSSVAYSTGLEALLTENGATWIATGDLDENGSLDLVVGNRKSNRLSVLLGAKTGTFAPGVTYSVDGNLRGLALGDFDGNGSLDIAAADDTGSVSLLLGTGTGKFGNKRLASTGNGLVAMAASDLDRDGRLDLVTVGDLELTVLLGMGDGTFAMQPLSEGAFGVSTLTIDDFDADGQADLALTVGCPNQSSQGGVQILLGHGDGTFSNNAFYPTWQRCLERIAIADVNGDGAADLLSSSLSLLLGNGDGTFQPESYKRKVGGGQLLALSDWNGDGKLDLATGYGRSVMVHLGNGDGSFGSNEIYATSLPAQSLALVDLDRNGELDAVSATAFSWRGGPGASAVNVLFGTGLGTFSPYVEYETSSNTESALPADLNGDGWQDVLTSDANSTIGVLLGTSNGQLAPQMRSQHENISATAVGDLNGDARPDLVLVKDLPQTFTLLFGNGDGTFTAQPPVPLPTRPSGVTLFDANRDGKLDLALALFEAGKASVLLGKGDGTFAPGGQYATGAGHGRLATADLNSDGKLDLVSWKSESLSILLGRGDGSFAPPVEYSTSVYQVLAIDFDQNQRQDLVINTGGGLAILFGAGDGTFTCAAHYPIGSATDGLGVSDLNHDGRMDIATSTDFGVNVFLNSTP